jgi:hypothetical protein
MPKRPRQSHIPSQPRRRKPRRTQDFSAALPATDGGETDLIEAASPVAATPAAPVIGRRLRAVQQAREGFAPRSHPGELPTYERTFLVRELTQISIVAGSLLALIIVLWLVMR